MRIETIHGRKVAFGLQWVDGSQGRDGAIASVYGFDGERPSRVYVTREARDGRNENIGVGAIADRVSGKLYSAAAAIASIDRDGFYVLPIAGGAALWFCGIQNGLVVPRTDVALDADSRIADLVKRAAAARLPVVLDDTLLGTPTAAAFADATTMDVAGIIGRAKIESMTSVGRNPLKVVLVVGTVAVVAMGLSIAYFSHPNRASRAGADAQALRQQQEQTYLSNVKQEIGAYPNSSRWAVTALRDAYRVFPPYTAGWELTKIDCQPASCVAEYRHQGNDGYALSPLVSAFGEGNVSTVQLGQSVLVTLPLTTPVAAVDEGWLRSLKPAYMAYADWLGSIPETMAGGIAQNPVPAVDLGQKYQAAAAGMPPLFAETTQVVDASFLDASLLGALAARGSVGGFRITHVVWSPSPDTPGWQITWSRVHG